MCSCTAQPAVFETCVKHRDCKDGDAPDPLHWDFHFGATIVTRTHFLDTDALQDLSLPTKELLWGFTDRQELSRVHGQHLHVKVRDFCLLKLEVFEFLGWVLFNTGTLGGFTTHKSSERGQKFSVIRLFAYSFVHSFIHSFIHSSIHSFIHSFSQSVSQSAIHAFIHSFVSAMCVKSKKYNTAH